MSRPRTKFPAYRHYKPKDLAVVRIAGKDHYLGQYGTDESYERYHRLLAESFAESASGTRAPATTSPTTVTDAARAPLTISELIWQYWCFVQSYYVKNGEPTSEQDCIRSALRPLRRLYGQTPVADFGPMSLKLVREHMVAAGLCRTTINKYVFRIKRLFEWGVEQEIVDVSIHQALKTVRGLAKGRTKAIEPRPVRKVTPDRVEATLPHLSPTLSAMVKFQRLTGCRPSEVCLLRPLDVDRTSAVWCYQPLSHKTEHHDCDRKIFIGPDAQVVLRPFLDRDPESFCFSPRDAAAKRDRKPSPRRRPGARYTAASYRRAVARACEIAFGMPEELRVIASETSNEEKAKLQALARAWRDEHCWSPNQLRHLRATEIRSQFGLEASQTVLGHVHCNTTELYAERDGTLAENVALQIG